MKNVFKKNGESGFSLVELMIVVGIIGVLATLALPRFKQFQAKAKMGEAKNMLSHIYTLEQTYSLDNNQFLPMPATGATLGAQKGCVNAGGNTETLGFKIDPCVAGANGSPTPRFSYDVITANTNSAFTAHARSGTGVNNRVCPGNGNGGFDITVTDANVSNEGAALGAICVN